MEYPMEMVFYCCMSKNNFKWNLLHYIVLYSLERVLDEDYVLLY